VPLIALGTGLLWFGWYGFNAGSELAVDSVTASAFLNTDVAASFAAMTWLFVEWSNARQPKFVGLLTGSVAGLATITPAAGYVSLSAAAIIGILAGLACYYAVMFKNKLGWDDALDVWGVHGVGGMLGTILLGVFAAKAWNPAGADGLLNGNARFFFTQVVAVALAGAWAFVFTYGVLWAIDLVTPVKVDAKVEEAGLDTELHGEEAYPDTI
jgi:Amt family ammonium transporter